MSRNFSDELKVCVPNLYPRVQDDNRGGGAGGGLHFIAFYSKQPSGLKIMECRKKIMGKMMLH